MLHDRTREQQKQVQIETIRAFLQVAQQAYQTTNDPRLENVISKRNK